MNPLVSFHQMLVFALVCHSLTHLLRSSEIMEPVRKIIGVRDGNENSFMSRMFRCPFCTGWWVGVCGALMAAAMSPCVNGYYSPFNPLSFGGVELVTFVAICAFLSAVFCYVFELAILLLEEKLSEFESAREGPGE